MYGDERGSGFPGSNIVGDGLRGNSATTTPVIDQPNFMIGQRGIDPITVYEIHKEAIERILDKHRIFGKGRKEIRDQLRSGNLDLRSISNVGNRVLKDVRAALILAKILSGNIEKVQTTRRMRQRMHVEGKNIEGTKLKK